MLVHLVRFEFKPDVDSQQREAILTLARKKLAELPGVRHLLVGRSIKPDSEYDYALSMYFENEQALKTYRDHPDHVHFRDVEFFPFLKDVQGLDYAD